MKRVCIALVVLSVGWATPALAATYTVSPGQLANTVTSANDGDVIRLRAGDYTGDFHNALLLNVGKSLTFESVSTTTRPLLPYLEIYHASLPKTVVVTGLQLRCPATTGAQTARSVRGGGANHDITLEDVVIDGCPAATWSAITGNMESLTIRNSSIQPNGNGIELSNADVLLEQSAFSQGGLTGRAVTLSGGSLSTDQSTFSGFREDNGGAIWLDDAAGSIANTGFTDNHATTDGGAIWYESRTSDRSLQIEFSTFANNHAGGSGSAVKAHGAQGGLSTGIYNPSVYRSLFTGNTGATATVLSADTTALVAFGNSWCGNSAPSTVDLSMTGGGAVGNSFANSTGDLQAWLSGDAINLTFVGASNDAVRAPVLENVLIAHVGGDATQGSPSGSYNAYYDVGGVGSAFGAWKDNAVTADPLLVNYVPGVSACQDLNLWLKWDSPLRDAGTPSLHPDLDGTRADIGAYGGAIADLDDADSDGWYENYDCDESNTAINPGATEQYYNGVDQNCDQLNDYDADHDGYVATAHNNQAGGSATGTGDCDDNTATTYPTATDAWYDGVDADCANDSDFDQDGDGEDCDGTKVAACSGHTGTDCVDDPAGLTNRLGTTIPGNAINQAATETWYEDVDQDCNGANDYDQDGDGFVAEGYDAFVGTLQVGDCLDQDANAYPGHVDAWYDGKDANCDDKNDYDQDGDGFVATAYNSFAGGTAPDTDDCDDNPTDDSTIQASSIYPGYPTDPAYDGIDQDCDGANDFDADGDGYVATAHNSEAGGTATGTDDCNDNVDAIYPAALEVWYDGTDQDCSNTSDYDQDGDGQDSAADGTGTDCDDDPTDDPTTGVTAAQTYLNAPADAWYDGIDQNCDGASDYDQDADGDDCDGTVVSACAGHTGTDCVDDPAGDGGIAGADIRLGATEVWYDGVDQDCSGTSDYDQDGDGYECDGSVAASPCPGHTGDDCIDEPAGLLSSTGSQINPGAEEVWYDGVDQDCDGNDEDQDGDGYDNVDDCADDNVNVYPGAAEIPYDGEDNDCSGDEDLTDVDGDGFDSDLVSGGTDCDDDDATVNPDATDDSVDGVDQDCDGTDAGTPIDTGGDSDSGMTDSDPVDSDTGTSDDETGCNCSSSSAPMGMLWLGLAAPLMVRRRR